MIDKFLDKFVGFILFSIAVPLVLFFFLLMFVIGPVSLYAESQCLAAGYPKAYVTWDLKRYCSNLDGSVTITVKQLEN